MTASLNDLLPLLAKIDVNRIVNQVDQIAEIGNLATGGVTRLAFSYEDKMARELLTAFMQAAGLQVTRDPIGNIIGRIEGSHPSASTIATGSHIDSVAHAGKFDGVLGVLISTECARIIQSNIELHSPIEVICFGMEESSRFGVGYGFGSRAMTGQPISDEELLSCDVDGQTLAAAVQQMKSWETGKLVDLTDEQTVLAETRKDILGARRDFTTIDAFIELHIEQGAVLEDLSKAIGIVTSVAAPTRLRIFFTGEQGHSGTTPMELRRDALAAAAESVLVLERISRDNSAKGIVGTVGAIRAHPGMMNVIPGHAEILIDIRGITPEAKRETTTAVLQEIRAIGNKRSIDIEIEWLTDEEPVAFSSKIIKTIENVCFKLDIPAMRLPSRAGHDAAHLARVTDTGMIFVPSIGGISHDPREATATADIEVGAQALLGTLLHLAV